jgi:hypothetical protein
MLTDAQKINIKNLELAWRTAKAKYLHNLQNELEMFYVAKALNNSKLAYKNYLSEQNIDSTERQAYIADIAKNWDI